MKKEQWERAESDRNRVSFTIRPELDLTFGPSFNCYLLVHIVDLIDFLMRSSYTRKSRFWNNIMYTYIYSYT